MPQLKTLFSPIKIGGTEFKNRIIMPGLGLRYNMARYRDLYVERAQGGAGLISCYLRTLDREGVGKDAPAIENDNRIPALREMTDAIHQAGGKASAQIAARLNWVKPDGSTEIVGPSSVNLALRAGTPDPRPLTLDDIQYIIEGQGDAARRAKEAGFDGVELHALGGTDLCSQFMSPVTNKRTDAYGGDLEGRLSLTLETVQNIREKTGPDFPIFVRISGTDFIPGGYGLEEVKQVAVVLETNGVDALNVSTGWYRAASTPFIQMGVPEGAWLHLAENVKQAVNIPVIGGTNIRDPLFADRVLAGGQVDMLYMARSLLADAGWPNKAEKGDMDNIRLCIACCHCMDSNGEEYGLECAINARVGREAHYALKAATQVKKVLVIGGGPAGMEAARVASERGHKVTLWEKGEQLGGELLVASLGPRKSNISSFTRYLVGQMERLGVEVKLNHTATVDAVLAAQAGVVIVATGADPVALQIPGVDSPHVIRAVDVLSGQQKTGKKVVVVGGEMVGCEVAESLAEQGNDVTLLARRGRIGDDIGRTNRWVVNLKLKELGVHTEIGVNVVEVKADGVNGIQQDSSRFFPADSVVLAVGFRSDNKLLSQLEGKVGELHAIGDCVEPRRIAQAVENGYRVAKDI